MFLELLAREKEYGGSIKELSSIRSSQCSCSLLFMQKKIADFIKLPFMLRVHLITKFYQESDGSWCTAAEKATSNLETEHVITIIGSRGPTVRKSLSLSDQQLRVQVAIPYLDTLIANINSRFSGEVVELVV